VGRVSVLPVKSSVLSVKTTVPITTFWS